MLNTALLLNFCLFTKMKKINNLPSEWLKSCTQLKMLFKAWRGDRGGLMTYYEIYCIFIEMSLSSACLHTFRLLMVV